jgi:ketosteroid isomerase-like protein
MVMINGGHRMGKAEVVKMISGVNCNIKEGWSLTEPQMEKIDNDTYVLTYKTTMDGTCTFNGKTEKQPSPVRAATVWVRNGEKWQAAFHGGNPIVDPKALSATGKREESKKGGPKKDTAGTPSLAKPTADQGTDGMMAAEKSVWEAWKAKDAKKIEDLTAVDISFVNIFGAYFANKADAIKDWTGATCDVKSFSLTDGVGTLVSPTVGILTVVGSVDGNCGGQKPPMVYGTSVYVKDGDTWKWAFGFNSPA